MLSFLSVSAPCEITFFHLSNQGIDHFFVFFLFVGHLDIDYSIILFSRDLDAVVEITALLGVILLQLGLTPVPAPQTKNL